MKGDLSIKRILVIDDEEGIRLLCKEELEEEGYEVLLAADGEEGLKIFDSTSIDLVILDINMPGIKGIDVLRQIKGKRPTLPVILLSAYSEYKSDLGSWASDDYIIKSSSLDEVKASIKRLLA